MIRRLNKGQKLEKWELEEIANNFSLSYHARQRLEERGKEIDVKNLILNSCLAYYNTDGTINIAKDKYFYLVVAIKTDGYTVVTYKEKSHNGITIFEKRALALRGVKR